MVVEWNIKELNRLEEEEPLGLIGSPIEYFESLPILLGLKDYFEKKIP